jgi:iron uptake system component EfeO
MPGESLVRHSARRTARRGVAAIGAAALVITTGAACSNSRTTARGGDPAAANQVGDLPPVLSHTVAVTVSSARGCQADHTTYAAGELLVSITNQDALGVSAVQLRNGAQLVGERADVPAGFTGSFAVTAPPGTYTLFCPGAAGAHVPIRIVGASMPAGSTLQALLDRAGAGYGKYVGTQAGNLVTAATALHTALAHGSTAAAKSAYARARSAYGRIATITEPFDDEINAHAGEESAADWNGFHRIEKGLFEQKVTTGLAGQATWLVEHARKLKSLAAKVPLGPDDLTHAAMDLLTGLFRSALLGVEEPYSHYDLLDVAANVAGAQQSFVSLQPALQRIDPMLTARLAGSFSSLVTLLHKYRCSWMPSGYDPFDQLTDAQVTGLSQAVQAVVEPLSMAASLVVS